MRPFEFTIVLTDADGRVNLQFHDRSDLDYLARIYLDRAIYESELQDVLWRLGRSLDLLSAALINEPGHVIEVETVDEAGGRWTATP